MAPPLPQLRQRCLFVLQDSDAGGSRRQPDNPGGGGADGECLPPPHSLWLLDKVLGRRRHSSPEEVLLLWLDRQLDRQRLHGALRGSSCPPGPVHTQPGREQLSRATVRVSQRRDRFQEDEASSEHSWVCCWCWQL